MNTFLPQFGLLHFQGEQAAVFLQGQLTADVQLLKTDGSTFTAYCDAKGRIIASGWIFKIEDEIYFLLSKNILDSTQKQLTRYAMFSKVLITDVSSKFVIGASLPSSPDLLGGSRMENQKRDLPVGPGDDVRIPVFKNAFRAFTITPIEVIESPFTDVSTAWEQADFNDRLVMITPETQNLFIPQMLNYEKMGGVSFTKGCYVGQEIIARTQHLGKMKRHVYAGTTPDVSIQPGQALLNSAKEVVGTIAMVVDAPEGKAFLAVISDAVVEAGEEMQTVANNLIRL